MNDDFHNISIDFGKFVYIYLRKFLLVTKRVRGRFIAFSMSVHPQVQLKVAGSTHVLLLTLLVVFWTTQAGPHPHQAGTQKLAPDSVMWKCK